MVSLKYGAGGEQIILEGGYRSLGLVTEGFKAPRSAVVRGTEALRGKKGLLP